MDALKYHHQNWIYAWTVDGDLNSNASNTNKYRAGSGGYANTDLYGRPIAGYMNLCRTAIDSQIENGVLTWEESVALIIHETFHILGI